MQLTAPSWPAPRCRARLSVVAALFALLVAGGGAAASTTWAALTKAECGTDEPSTVAAPVDFAQVLHDLYALTDERGERLFLRADPHLERTLAEVFDPRAVRSKLEQFYAMLFLVAQHTSHPAPELQLDPPRARALLLAARVFSDPEFPRRITRIALRRTPRRAPRFEVRFDAAEVRLPLNQGRGFGIFREGMCQHAKALVFYEGFAFALAHGAEGLEVSDFDGVDLWGDFGTRGLVDIDLNYVSVRSVTFMKGSALGLVKAKVSRREFEVNRHSPLLEFITRFVTDKSVQPIDW